jgi:hypothetical protein
LAINGRCLQSHYLATARHATLLLLYKFVFILAKVLLLLTLHVVVLANIFTGFDRAIAQVVSRWISTAAARVRFRVWSSGIYGRQSGAGAGFLRVLRFPLPIFIPPIAPQSPSPITWGWYNRPEAAAVQGI